MATATSSSASLLFSASSSNLLPLSHSCTPRLSFSSSLQYSSSSLSISPTTLPHLSSNSRRFSTHHVAFSINNAASASVKKKVLIINTDSGGHAIIGFYFAKELLGAGHAVTILTVGEEGSDKNKKPPFSRFSEIVSAGGRTVWGNPAEVGSVVGGESFDVVLDNNGKDLETVRPVIDWAKSSGAKQFLFISSAGIYKPTDEPPHVEGDAVNASAGHLAVEKYIEETFESWTVFRPQYITGSGNNKDCEEWFFDRIVRDRPVLIPGSGLQLTNIAHARDLSSLLTLAVEKPEAANRSIFNSVSDRAITLNGIAKLCAQVAGRPVNIVNYDPKAVGVDAKKAFPFRPLHFYAEPRAAKTKLGWSPTTNLPEDLKERFEEYIKIGRDKKSIKFELDDKILEALKVPVSV